MALSDEQKLKVKSWVEAGLGLSDVQKKIHEEFGESMTFMDVRFLVIDLGAKVKDKPQAPKVQPTPTPDVMPKAGKPAPKAYDLDPPAAGGGGVSVAVDRVTKAGAVASGNVKFSDGVTASWSLDQYGRLGLAASTPGYKPSEADVAEFQMELQNALAKMGY